jgi:hypothetical protein
VASRMPKRPGHRNSGEFLREVVAAVVPEEDCARYMPFARELYATFHHPPMPDFDHRTKLAVQRWFQRGLSGHLMWLIGRKLLGRLYPPAGNAVRVNW